MISSSSLALLLFCDSLLFIAALASGKPPEFDYSDTQKWGSLDPSFAACSTGKRQSPIDIKTNDAVVNKAMQPLTRDYHVYNASLTTDGIDTEVEFTGLGELIIDGKAYKLKQMHWHTPSEHLFNGKQYAAELHQVHVAPDGSSRTVVGMLYKLGNPDPVLSMLKPQLDELAKVATCEGEVAEIAIPKFESKFLRKRPRKYYRYPGSLTTPPCDENVIWNVLTKVKTISQDQVEALKAPLCEANKLKNARPIQTLNGRTVQLYDGN